ncbi:MULTISPECIES: hypothetical protein [unclassified Rhizobium]|uniref:hypothetical protein n=1 Tax=unclassified Rhizobium TaxID=2613769 RepID=UPI0010536EF3|nr:MULTISPECIES: hypothetical protein [unclassified Rhizobium]MBB3394945.1 hypothetical protein [Rhizobium sp. BK060]MBB4167456.1 hypothetical protein [Rhizobium sp. BK538]TCM78544.1 hypothetical protein EV291_105166 [Rhizobium sp. BK068]
MATTLLSRHASVRLLLAIGMLILTFAGNAHACAICFSGLVVTPGQKLDAADEAVLAVPLDGQGQFRIVDVVKGDGTVGDVVVQPGLSTPIADAVMSVDGLTVGDGEATKPDEKPLLLLHDKVSEKWTSLGAMPVQYAGWLRQLAQTKHSAETPKRIWPQLTLTSSYLTDAEWHERIDVVAPQLESGEPLVAEIAFGELSRAPYGVTRLLKPQLDAAKLATWTNDPKLASRRAAYTVLLGIAGGPDTATALEQDVATALKTRDATNLSAMLAADLELRGTSRVDWLETTFFADRRRTLQEIQAALLALSVHGGADGAVPRQRVIEAYRYFIKARSPMAGFVAMELADWEAWDATADYVAIIRSKAVKDPAEQFAILSYLQRSPLTTAQAALRAFAD